MLLGFPPNAMVKNPPANAGDAGLIPGSRRSPGEGNGNSLQYSCLGNLLDRGAWQAIQPLGSKEWDMTEHAHTCQPLFLKCIYLIQTQNLINEEI